MNVEIIGRLVENEAIWRKKPARCRKLYCKKGIGFFTWNITYLDLVGSVQETLFQLPATAVSDTPHKS